MRCFKDPQYNFLRVILQLISKQKIISGIFKGLKFNVPNFNTAMLIGTWELELFSVLNEILKKKFSTIFVVGAAEGYYAVGFSQHLPDTNIFAFEKQFDYRGKLKRLTISNDSKNIHIEGNCDSKILKSHLQLGGDNPFLFCDIEGGEIRLLNLKLIPDLAKTELIVEVHEMYVENCQQRLLDEFKDTHNYTIIYGRERRLDDLPVSCRILSFFASKETVTNLMNEGRPYPMNWIWFQPIN